LTGRPLAFCQKGHLLASAGMKEGQRVVRYSAAGPGQALQGGKPEDGHFNYAAYEDLITVSALEDEYASFEIMCPKNHGAQMFYALADLLPVVRGERGPITIRV
jgi:hypothetical protein